MTSVSKPIFIIASLILCGCNVRPLEIGSCSYPLGMESGKIKDADISASSSYDHASVGPQHGRLRGSRGGGAWCPRRPVSRRAPAAEYLQVGLGPARLVSGARTQGRRGPRGAGREFAEHYAVEYWRPAAAVAAGAVGWIRWRDRRGRSLLTGNTNTYSVVEQRFDPPIVATRFRFLPYSDHVRTVCMRVELLGCDWTAGLLSYEMPQGEGGFGDETYDGVVVDGGLVRGGLGQLVDGRSGADDPTATAAHPDDGDPGYEWVGWKNDTVGRDGLPLEILFEFDRVRNFTAVHLYANNMVTRQVQIFSRARAFFGMNGKSFDPAPVYFSHTPDTVSQSRNVTIKLHHRLGKYLKLQLYFTSAWILLSEVTFDSVLVPHNFSEAEDEGDSFSEYVSKEYSYQRDEVKITTKATLRPLETYVERPKMTYGNILDHQKQYTNFVIGLLITTIVLLLAAIAFIVSRGATPTPATPLPDATTTPEKKKEAAVAERGLAIGDDDDGTSVPDVTYPTAAGAVAPTPAPAETRRRALEWEPALEPNDPPPPVPPPPADYLSPHASNQQHRLPVEVPVEHCVLPAILAGAFRDVSPERPPTIVRDALQIVDEIGEGKLCRVYLCHVMPTPDLAHITELTALYVVKDEAFAEQFREEIYALSHLDDENVAKLLAICTDASGVPCALREYSEYGDLCQFLQDHVAESTTPLATNADTLSYNCLLHMATQVASAMAYLESHRFAHKDLAARNCLVCSRCRVKISDVGAYRSIYNSDYYLMGERLLPIRWMAWESIHLHKYDSRSDAWSFAVLFWEILTFAREQPFDDFTDEEVLENSARYCRDAPMGDCVRPACPIGCPGDVFDLMEECWQRNAEDRPCFREIHLFLQRKSLAFDPNVMTTH